VHLLLTDRLTCPRCGPSFGLILLANRLEDRVVDDGVLGCPNCRDSFPITDGFGDLRSPPRGEMPEGLAGKPVGEIDGAGERVVALLGVVGGAGTIALVGEAARYASVVAAALGEVQVVAIDPDLRYWPELPRISRIAAAPGLPFFDSTLRAVAVDGRLERSSLSEAARVVSPGGRVVVVRAPVGASAELEEEGLRLLASEEETVVAVRG
jgi:uncharacterized protein YbaR (Trm112 family)